MIFVTLGSQKFQFDRLLKKIDQMVESEEIKDKVFAQIGYSTYIPKHYTYERFMNRKKFNQTIEQSNLVITHGGTGVIINAVKKGRKVIAVPRLSKYGEHVDDHQIQLISQFDGMGIIMACYDLNDIEEIYTEIGQLSFAPYQSNTERIISSIDHFIKN